MTSTQRGIPISLNHISKSFGAKPVLNGVQLEVKAGQFVAIVGKSGSGKSTLVRLIAGLDTPTNGDVLVNGSPLRGINNLARIMFQDARLLPWRSILDNVGIGLKQPLWENHAREVLAHVGLLDRHKEWPNVLSGGERQRVALARALVTRPSLLLLDEPLGALDALTRIDMQRLIERIWREEGFTALLITHDVEEAVAMADRVVLLENGQIALDLEIDLPRPHPRGSGQFAQLKEYVLGRVLRESTAKPA